MTGRTIALMCTAAVLAAGAWWLAPMLARRWSWVGEAGMAVASVVLVAALTRLPANPVDPASPVVPTVGLYPVTMSMRRVTLPCGTMPTAKMYGS